MEYFAFQWHITEACDQRCKHCYIYALGSHAKFQEMALEDMVRVIENCQAFCRKAGRLPYFYLTGGDPILHPQFWQLAGLLKARGLPFAILGNPFHLTDDVCQKLRDHGCRKYQLSLDGLRETHDRIRRPGSYDETLAAIPLLRRAGIHVALMATVSKWNVQEIPALVDVGVEHQADIFAFARYCPSQADRDTTCSPWNTGPCWKPAGRSSRPTKPPGAQPPSPERTTCGPSSSTRRACSISTRPLTRTPSTTGATAATAT